MIGFLVMGWALYYLPFSSMGRRLFLHHYFPALWYAILTLAAVLDLVSSTLFPKRRIQVAAVMMALVIWTYAHSSPLAYGNSMDFSCKDNLDDVSFPLGHC
jgi:dolichyl-phosphate-mannose-protein mannosyltransferase